MKPEFDVETFLVACRVAVRESDGQRATHELVAEVFSRPAAVASAIPEPERAGIETLYRAPDLTVLSVTWAPWMCTTPHNHNMWAIIGIFAGREDNVFWRRADRTIEAAGARSLGTGDVTVLGRDVIHSITNPIGRMTRAIHVYGGDFFAPPLPRAEWDHETLTERPWSADTSRRRFAEADARARAGR